MGVGMGYGNEYTLCEVHGGQEMFHSCAGGQGEALGYCTEWDGEMVGGHLGKDGKTMYGGSPTCQILYDWIGLGWVD